MPGSSVPLLSVNFPSLPSWAAPSTVPIMHQVSATMRSITLSWPQPEQPNGIILDYELRYYEKLSRICTPDGASPGGSRPAAVSWGEAPDTAGLGGAAAGPSLLGRRNICELSDWEGLGGGTGTTSPTGTRGWEQRAGKGGGASCGCAGQLLPWAGSSLAALLPFLLLPWLCSLLG